MIPKKIHYCWFGGSELPPLAKACIASWVKHLPDYELVRWDETNSPNNEFINYHLEKGNWAFVSDYVRLYALYQYGGLYFDTDVEVIKSFDLLLKNNGFVAYEEHERMTNGVAGGVKENIFFNDCMKYMIDRFENNEDYHISPTVTTTVLNSGKYDVTIFDAHYFYPYNPYDLSNEIKIFMYQMVKEDTYAIHHWAKSWSYEKSDDKYQGTGLCDLFNGLCSKLSSKLRALISKK